MGLVYNGHAWHITASGQFSISVWKCSYIVRELHVMVQTQGKSLHLCSGSLVNKQVNCVAISLAIAITI